MTSPTKFYGVTQIILKMWPCDQSLVTLLAFFMREVIIKDLPRKTTFLRGGLGSNLIILDWH